MSLETIAAVEGESMRPIWVLLISVAWVVLSIAKFKIHPFLSLMVGALIVGLLSGPLPETTIENKGLFHSRVELNPSETSYSEPTLAIKWSLYGFGNTAGGVGLVIALAAIVGTCMMKSGAAERVVRHLLGVFGLERAGLVLLISGFLLSIPVFFDTVFFLLIPLARAMSFRLGSRYLYFVMTMAGAGAITHSMVPPTPGPLMIAEFLSIEIGHAMLAGLIASIPLAFLVLWVSGWFDRKFDFPMRPVAGIRNEDLKRTLEKDLNQLPPLFQSYLPIVLPVLLISSVSIIKVLYSQGLELDLDSFFYRILSFCGDPNIAMSIAALISIVLLIGYGKNDLSKEDKPESTSKILEAPLLTAASIILITGAGGAYGGMIRLSGVGEVIGTFATRMELSYILLAWSVTAFIRVAQGSATVAMITGAGLMASIVGNGNDLGYHPGYLFLAIGFGSITLSWMNDSGFWVVQKLSGLTENEMLKTWSVLLTVISVFGLILSLAGSVLLPLK